MLMGVSAVMAIRRAIKAIKKDLGQDPKEWFSLCKLSDFFLTAINVLIPFRQKGSNTDVSSVIDFFGNLALEMFGARNTHLNSEGYS